MPFVHYEPNKTTLSQERARDSRETVFDFEDTFFLQKGITSVRILPPYSEEGVWFRELVEYRIAGEGSATFLTAPEPGEPDPVADFIDHLRSLGDEASLEVAKELRPRRQYLFNALILSAPQAEFEKGKVYVLKTGVSVKRDLLQFDQDEQLGWADITNLEKGVNFNINRTGTGLKTEYNVSPMSERTNVQEYLASVGVDINTVKLHDLNNIYTPREASEMQAVLKKAFPNYFRRTPSASVLQPVEESPTADEPKTELVTPAVPPPPMPPAKG